MSLSIGCFVYDQAPNRIYFIVILIVGGYSHGAQLYSAEFLDPVTGEGCYISPLPEARSAHSQVKYIS